MTLGPIFWKKNRETPMYLSAFTKLCPPQQLFWICPPNILGKSTSVIISNAGAYAIVYTVNRLFKK